MVLAELVWAAPAPAQYVEKYFSTDVPGYNEEAGVPVLARPRPLYEEPTVRVGAFDIRPDLDEAVGFNSNVYGTPHAAGSWFINTSPSVTVHSDWTRNSFGAALSAQNYTYLDQPGLNHTDWTASIGGGYTIGRSDLLIGYTHLSSTELPTELGAAASSTGVPYTLDDIRAGYTFQFGRFSLTPNVEEQIYRFGNATLAGQQVSESAFNRDELSGGVTVHFALTEVNSLLMVLQGVDSHFTSPGSGPSNDSKSALALFGIDYLANGVWRYQFLVGVEARTFAAPQFGNQVAPIVEGTAIWTPTGLTTVTATLARRIEDPMTAGTGSFVYTNGRLTIDHELLRNVLLQGRAGFQVAQYLSGDTQASATFGASVTWLLNRHVRLSVNYDYTSQSSISTSSVPATFGIVAPQTGGYVQNVATVLLHVAL